MHKDRDEDQQETSVTVVTPPSAPAVTSSAEAPFAIFDRRQQWFIIAIVSTAATCRIQLAISTEDLPADT